MKTNFLALAAASLAGVLTTCGESSAWLGSTVTTRVKLHRFGSVIICRPYNAFTPVCYGNMVCDGCCPMPSCGPSMPCFQPWSPPIHSSFAPYPMHGCDPCYGGGMPMLAAAPMAPPAAFVPPMPTPAPPVATPPAPMPGGPFAPPMPTPEGAPVAPGPIGSYGPSAGVYPAGYYTGSQPYMYGYGAYYYPTYVPSYPPMMPAPYYMPHGAMPQSGCGVPGCRH